MKIVGAKKALLGLLMNDSHNEQKQITDHSSNCIDLTNMMAVEMVVLLMKRKI